ncbi:response regulator transcription factor [Paenibacillus humicola]|uniref:response regulator transcription factor n=1 Tax=Paenibacillus humicola TaxID=3110540 RepID=UPI00237C470B|nr:response regulator [Paenibacillus humicola]
MTSERNSRGKVKLLIVDDEPVICEGLRHTIDWDSLGVEVVGEAHDGEEALHKVQECRAELVLSDIRMDGMDGLELAEHLRSRFPKVRIVMISGYEDFGYARRAVRLNVSDYLLKPVEIDELESVIGGIARDIRKEDARGSDKENELWLANRARGLTGYEDEPLPAGLRATWYRVLCTQAERYAERYSFMSAEEWHDMQRQWLQAVETGLAANSLRSVSVFHHANMLVTLAMADGEPDDAAWDKALEAAVRSWRTSGGKLYGSASGPFREPAETAERCAEARSLLDYHVLEQWDVLEPGNLESIRRNRKPPAFDAAAGAQQLVLALFQKDRSAVAAAVGGVFHHFRKERFLLSEAAKASDELSVLLRLRLRQSGLTGLEDDSREPVDLLVYNSYESMEMIVHAEMERLLELVDRSGIDKSYWVIEKAKKYMAEQFTCDLKAAEVAAWLKITPSYFSQIFKQSTGKSFKEYMNELRIGAAKVQLAQTHDKVFEIAERVGYSEYKYFVSVFKTYTGMTPKEYRVLSVGIHGANRQGG